MVGLMVESTAPLLKKWEAMIDAGGGLAAEINVDEDLRSVSADVIARACFGSSYDKGKQIFSKLRTIQTSITKQGFLFGLNGSRYNISINIYTDTHCFNLHAVKDIIYIYLSWQIFSQQEGKQFRKRGGIVDLGDRETTTARMRRQIFRSKGFNAANIRKCCE